MTATVIELPRNPPAKAAMRALVERGLPWQLVVKQLNLAPNDFHEAAHAVSATLALECKGDVGVHVAYAFCVTHGIFPEPVCDRCGRELRHVKCCYRFILTRTHIEVNCEPRCPVKGTH